MNFDRRSVWRVAVLAGVCGMAAAAAGKEVKVPCSRDVWVSAVGGSADERDRSMGKTSQLKLKSIQEMAILDFDLSALAGKTVGGGWLYFHIVDNRREAARFGLPFARKHLLRRIGLSTVATDWLEGRADRSYTIDKAGCGATFNEASYSKRPWAWRGSTLANVIFGSGNTLQGHAELEELKDLWARVRVPDDLIQSLICRDGFGLCMMDEIGFGLPNNFIHSREARGREPYLVVNVTGKDTTAPQRPRVAVRAAPKEAHLGSGAAVIEITGPTDAFCYFVQVNGRDVPRWRVPHPTKGKSVVLLDDSQGGKALSVSVWACDAAGNRSAAVKASGSASAALKAPPKLPAAWKPAAGDPPVRSGKMRVWAVPEVCKVDPVSGALWEAKALGRRAGAYRRANSVWDGASNSVRVFGAAGEIVAFQLCIERADASAPLKDIAVTFDALAGPGTIAADRIRLFRVWYTPIPEYALPLPVGQKLAIPSADNKLPGAQRNQTVYVDIAVPQGTKPGRYTGKIRIAAEGVAAFELPVTLKVYGFAIPDKMRFNPELNLYGSPARPGSKAWFESFRAAHYNRCTFSITLAGHGDGINGGLGMPVEGRGAGIRVKDWSRWDAAYGPLLDGSAFKDLPRAGVPLASCQIPLGHGYPLKLDSYYQYNGPKKHKNVGLVHALLCKPIDRAFGREYKEGFRNFAGQIVRHFERKGWHETYFMFYLDAKVMWRVRGSGTSYWTLDEPFNYDDWVALRFWGKLFRDAVDKMPKKPKKAKKARWGYRCDISRPQWTHDWLEGVMTTMYVGGLMRNVRTVQQMAKEDGQLGYYSYGACNNPAVSNWNSAAWCLTTFLAGGDGVLPWQSLGSARSLTKPDKNGLIVPNVGGHGAVASLRVLALRRGAQDCEYLLTLGERCGLGREQLRAMVAQKITSKATLKQLSEDHAAPVSFDKLDPAKFAELREGVAKLIEAAKDR